ncbi:hypothetical protein KY290_008966 [Solanum tuberosum]|uniref:Uncharacterized protein n=1 Tax=Solanum tuberosum TaxID=4113 RepID=A0ABQ7WC50_SOLTU|nr:hypothetical protein KY290_008966 [Solanum tuberosum]
MSKAERIQFCQLIKEVKFPDAYASNISQGTIIHFITPFLIGCLIEKRSLEMWLPKLSSQGSKKTIPKELVDANNQVFEEIHEELKARSMLRTTEETEKRLLSEKSSLEAKIVKLEKKKSSEDEHP